MAETVVLERSTETCPWAPTEMLDLARGEKALAPDVVPTREGRASFQTTTVPSGGTATPLQTKIFRMAEAGSTSALLLGKGRLRLQCEAGPAGCQGEVGLYLDGQAVAESHVGFEVAAGTVSDWVSFPTFALADDLAPGPHVAALVLTVSRGSGHLAGAADVALVATSLGTD